MNNKDINFGIRPVDSKDIVGAGFTLVVGHLVLPFIPFDKVKDFRAFPNKSRKMKGGMKR